jgi:maltoporin
LPKYSIQWALLYRQEDRGVTSNSEFDWVSTGVRPIIYFSKHINLAFEVSIDHIDDKINNRSGSLSKLTTALQIAANRGFKSRPIMRFFVTFADWSDELQDLVGNTPADAPYADSTQGWTLGAQAEVWW